MKRCEFLTMMIVPFLGRRVLGGSSDRVEIANKALISSLKQGTETFRRLGYATETASIRIGGFGLSVREVK